MITHLASPSVCVIDDEKQDYESILAALNGMYISSVHLLGNEIDKLPPEPFKRLQLVFLDLHLSGSVGKDAASYTANVFTKVVSADTAPIIVVIWSKYAQDKVDTDLPPEDQETEAELFKRTLLGAVPAYRERLIFVAMDKPKPGDRQGDFVDKLKTNIRHALDDQHAVALLWDWHSLVKDACVAVSASLTSVAAEQTGRELKDNLKSTLQRLTRAQADNDLSAATAPSHFVSVLGEILSDQLENMNGGDLLAPNGAWLAADPTTAVTAGFAARMNGLLMTAGPSGGVTFAPGTVFRLTRTNAFAPNFGAALSTVIDALCGEGANSPKRIAWNGAVQPVLVELSPVCDVAQNQRATAMLVAGAIVPVANAKSIKAGEAFAKLPAFKLRWAAPSFPEQDEILVFCHRYKATLAASSHPDWIEPWFRLRDLPTASIRNAQSGHASRVGYVLLQD